MKTAAIALILLDGFLSLAFIRDRAVIGLSAAGARQKIRSLIGIGMLPAGSTNITITPTKSNMENEIPFDPNDVKIGIVGSRSFWDYMLMQEKMDRVIAYLAGLGYTVTTIVSGGAKGADLMAENYAASRGLRLIVHLPDHSKGNGNMAYYLRNVLIVDDSDFLVAFYDGKSKGTKLTIDIAAKQEKTVIIVDFKPKPIIAQVDIVKGI